MSRILVTGATGFVGGHLLRAMGDRGLEYTAAARDSSRPLNLTEKGRLAIVGDIDAETDWSEALQNVSTVIHLAARVHQMRDTAEDPLAEFRRINVDGAMALYRQAKDRGVASFIFLSSVKAMGEAGAGKALSDDDLAQPEDPYGTSKWEAEQALLAEARSGGPRVTILRPPLLYGPGAKGNMLSLFKACRKGLPLPFGAVKARRSILYVENLTDAIIAVAQSKPLPRSTYLVSDAEAPTVAALVQNIYRALGCADRSVSLPPTLLRGLFRMTGRADMARRLLDDLVVNGNNLNQDLDWQPPFDLTEGLDRTALWFNQCFE